MYNNLLNCAKDSALKAGEILKDGFGTIFEIRNKEGKNNLVTEFDLKAEKIIIDNIKSKFSNHSFLAEESGKSGVKSFSNPENIRWIIDPLDGTVNYAHNLPIFSVSIAAELNGEIICGVIYQPILNELFYATKGSGAFKNDKQIKVSKNTDIDTAFMVTGFPYNAYSNPGKCIDQFCTVLGKGIPVRRLGSAAMDLAYVASGVFDGFWEVSLKPWDVAAGLLLVKEAGGQISHYDGKRHTFDNESIVASNGLLHKDILKLIKI